MNEIIRNSNYKGFLFSAVSGGCNGFNYNLELISKKDELEFSKASIMKNGDVSLIIEPTSEIYLLGTTIDYSFEDYKKGIFENKFVFIPDKLSAYSCGCGKSFTLK